MTGCFAKHQDEEVPQITIHLPFSELSLAATGFRAINTAIHKHFILNKPAAAPKKSLLNSVKGLN